MAQFHVSAEFNCTPETLRELLGAPGNFEAITDPSMEFELVAAPSEVTVGEEMTFAIVTGGIRQVLRHRWITVSDLQIVVEQVEGPTEAWHHDQTISPSQGGCVLSETITFEPPGGMLGFMVTEAAILESLQRTTPVGHQLIAEQLIARQPA
jgi:ligand-binding SRPBCC domain-containing protein